MAELIKAKFYPRERLDLPDFSNVQDFVETDAAWRNEYFIGGGSTPWVCKGFTTRAAASSNPDQVDVEIGGSVFLNLTDPSDLKGIMYIGDPTIGWITNVALVPSATVPNYVHVKIDRVTNSSVTRTFWDPAANGGLGGEYQQAVDTAEIKKASVVVTQVAPSTDPSHILVAKVISNGSITSLVDERNLFFRLGKNDQYVGIGAFTTPSFTAAGGGVGNDLVVSGGYTDSANRTYTITIDGTGSTFTWTDGTTTTHNVAITGTAQVLSYGCITSFTHTTGHIMGDSWTFVGVAAAAGGYYYRLALPIVGQEQNDEVLNSNAFVDGDKELDNFKSWMDFMMSQIKEIKFGSTATTNYWYQSAASNLSDFGIDLSGGGTVSWACAGTGPTHAGVLTFSSDFTILLPGTPFINVISATAYVGGISFPNDDYIAWVTVDRGSSAALTVYVDPAVDYKGGVDSVIIARRIAEGSNSIIYVGI